MVGETETIDSVCVWKYNCSPTMQMDHQGWIAAEIEQRGRRRKSFEMLDGGPRSIRARRTSSRCFRDKGNRLRRRIIIIVASGETERRVA